MILIGSKAIKEWFPEFPREPADVDYAVKDEMKSTRETEFLYNPIFCDYVGYRNMYNNTNGLPLPDELYTLKMSHMFWDVNYSKHLFDIQWLKEKGCNIIEPLFYDLYDFWNKHHSKNKRSDLKMNASKFFDNAIKCPHDHDWLHTLIKNPPTYTKILCDNAEVEVCEDKFNKLTFEEKCDLVREEIYVMAVERMPNLDYRIAYEKMLKNFVLNHAPIYEALFILDNFKHLYKPLIQYQTIIKNGILKSNSNN